MKFPISEQIRRIHPPPISEVKGWLAGAKPDLPLIDLCQAVPDFVGILREILSFWTHRKVECLPEFAGVLEQEGRRAIDRDGLVVGRQALQAKRAGDRAGGHRGEGAARGDHQSRKSGTGPQDLPLGIQRDFPARRSAKQCQRKKREVLNLDLRLHAGILGIFPQPDKKLSLQEEAVAKCKKRPLCLMPRSMLRLSCWRDARSTSLHRSDHNLKISLPFRGSGRNDRRFV